MIEGRTYFDTGRIDKFLDDTGEQSIRKTRSNSVRLAPTSDRSEIGKAVKTIIDRTNLDASASEIDGSSLERVNQGTDELKGSAEINTLVTGKPGSIVKDVKALPADVQTLLDKSTDLKSTLGQEKDLAKRVALLPEINRTIDGLTEALANVGLGSDSERLQDTLLLKDALGLDAKADSLSAAKVLLDDLNALRETVRSQAQVVHDFHVRRFGYELSEARNGGSIQAYADLLDGIVNVPQEELAPEERRDLCRQVLGDCVATVKEEIRDERLLKPLPDAAGKTCDPKEVLDAAASILARIRLADPDREVPVRLDDLFRDFIGAKNPGDDRFVGKFQDLLIHLAKVSDPSSKMTPEAFCILVDSLAGPNLDNYAATGARLISALAPDPKTMAYAMTKHAYKVAAKELLLKAPIDDLDTNDRRAVLRDLTHHTLTKTGLDVLTKLPNFQDIRNQVAHLVIMQTEMIRNGVTELSDAIGDDGRFKNIDLAKATPNEVGELRDRVASSLIVQLASVFDDPELRGLIEEGSGRKDGLHTYRSVHDVIDDMTERLRTFGEDYASRSVRGSQDEKKITETLQSVSGKIVGWSPESHLVKFYDGNVRNQEARTMDEVYRQLTGEYDPERRQMLKTTDRGQLVADLIGSLERSLSDALHTDSSKRLKGVDKDAGTKAIGDLLFDRESAGSMGFDFDRLDEDIDKSIQGQNAAYAKIKGIRHKLAKSLRHEEDFAKMNGEAIRLHTRKKQLHADIKAHERNVGEVFTCFWRWGARKRNVKKILELDQLKTEFDALNANPGASGNLDAYYDVKHRLDELFDELKSLDLHDLASHDEKNDPTIDDFLRKAVPLAKSFDYMCITKTVKNDLAEIKELKEQRDQCREKLDGYLSEAEGAYGKEVVLQIRRAAVIADHLARIDRGGSEPATFEDRCEEVFDFLKRNGGGMMSHCDHGMVGLLIRDALRRYAPAAGVVTGRRLERIRQELGSGRSDSLALKKAKKELGKDASNLIKGYKTKATRIYLERGAEGLMGMIGTKGQSFLYTKEKSFTVGTMPALVSCSISYMPSESFGVVNNGDSYTVVVKSEHAEKIAASLGIWIDPPAKRLGRLTLGVHGSATHKSGTGFAFSFKDAESVQGFIKDFMTPDSPIHKGVAYHPSWMRSSDIQTVGTTSWSAEIGVSASAALRAVTGTNSATNQIQVGNADYGKIETLDKYFESFDPSTHGNKNFGLDIKLPTATIGVTVSGDTKEEVRRTRNITTTKTSTQLRLDVKAGLTPIRITAAFKPVSKALDDAVSKVFENIGFVGETMEKITATLMQGLEKTELDPDAAKFLEETQQRLLETARRGETEDAEKVLLSFVDQATNPLLEAFIKGESDDRAVVALQSFATLALIERKLDFIGSVNTNGADVESGVQLKAGPLSIVSQVMSGRSENKEKAERMLAHPNGDGLPTQEAVTDFKTWKTRLGSALDSIEDLVLTGKGDPVAAIANLLDDGTSKIVEGRKGNISLETGKDDLVGVSARYRGDKALVKGEASMLKGANFQATWNFTGTCDTDTIVAYDEVQHQFTEDTGIDLTLRKDGFTLDNMFDLFHLPERVRSELAGNKMLMAELEDAYQRASDEDTVTLHMRIKPEVRKMLNELEDRRRSDTGDVKDIENRINALLDDADNFFPTSLDMTHTADHDVNFGHMPGSINLVLFSMEYKRTMSTGQTTEVSLEGLDSVKRRREAPKRASVSDVMTVIHQRTEPSVQEP